MQHPASSCLCGASRLPRVAWLDAASRQRDERVPRFRIYSLASRGWMLPREATVSVDYFWNDMIPVSQWLVT